MYHIGFSSTLKLQWVVQVPRCFPVWLVWAHFDPQGGFQFGAQLVSMGGNQGGSIGDQSGERFGLFWFFVKAPRPGPGGSDGASVAPAAAIASAAAVGHVEGNSDATGATRHYPSVPSAASVGLEGGSDAAGAAREESAAQSAAAVGLFSEGWQALFDKQMKVEGYFVFKGFVDKALVAQGVCAIKQRVQTALAGYGVSSAEDCGNLRECAKFFASTPANWEGIRFGGCDKRGWNISVGNGRMFTDWHDLSIDAIRATTLPVAAHWHGVPESALCGQPESCSVKPSGCPPLPAHLDQGRVGTLQIVIALSDTEVVLWPRSHKLKFNVGGTGWPAPKFGALQFTILSTFLVLFFCTVASLIPRTTSTTIDVVASVAIATIGVATRFP